LGKGLAKAIVLFAMRGAQSIRLICHSASSTKLEKSRSRESFASGVWFRICTLISFVKIRFERTSEVDTVWFWMSRPMPNCEAPRVWFSWIELWSITHSVRAWCASMRTPITFASISQSRTSTRTVGTPRCGRGHGRDEDPVIAAGDVQAVQERRRQAGHARGLDHRIEHGRVADDVGARGCRTWTDEDGRRGAVGLERDPEGRHLERARDHERVRRRSSG
jgi:hypothetical protein